MLRGLEQLSCEGRLRDLEFSWRREGPRGNILAAYHTLKGATKKLEWKLFTGHAVTGQGAMAEKE